jgi:type I restriction enzyme S subunit
MKKGWERKQIGDLCEVIAGQSPEGKFYNTDGKGIPFYQGKKDFGEKFIDAPTTWTTQTTKIAREGDILISVRAPVGPVNFATDEVCIGRGLAAIRSMAELNRDFLFYQLLHLQPEIAGKEGAVFASINKSEIEALPIAFAPLPEQQRIVGILDEAFDGIATAKANAEKNLQNACAIFESHLQSVFTQRGRGWVEQPLAILCIPKRIITYGVIKLGVEVPYGVPCLRTSNVRWLRIETEGMKRISPSLSSEYSRTILKGGEVLVNVRGTLGGVAVASREMAGWNVSREVAVVPVDPSRVNPSFLSYLIGSGVSQQWLGGVKKGAAYIGINIEDLRMLPVMHPIWTNS